MNADPQKIRKSRKRSAQEIGQTSTKVSQPVTLHRRKRSEFSCGVGFDRAILVGESMDEQERRG